MTTLRIAPPTSSEAFFAAAKEFNAGVQALTSSSPGHGFAATFLAGQAVECYLKSFLASTGLPEATLRRRPYGHDLPRLWQASNSAGLPVGVEPPDWLSVLAGLHGWPYYVRYPMGLNAIRLPNQAQLAHALADLEETIRPTVKRG